MEAGGLQACSTTGERLLGIRFTGPGWAAQALAGLDVLGPGHAPLLGHRALRELALGLRSPMLALASQNRSAGNYGRSAARCPSLAMTARTPDALDGPPSPRLAGFVVYRAATSECFLSPRRMAMATMIDGESYVGRVLIRPLSQAGDLTPVSLALAVPEEQNGGPHLRHRGQGGRNSPL